MRDFKSKLYDAEKVSGGADYSKTEVTVESNFNENFLYVHPETGEEHNINISMPVKSTLIETNSDNSIHKNIMGNQSGDLVF